MRGGREAEYVYARARVAEPRYRTAPVVVRRERGALLARDPLAPLDEPRAAAAADHAALEGGELRARVEPGRSLY